MLTFLFLICIAIPATLYCLGWYWISRPKTDGPCNYNDFQRYCCRFWRRTYCNVWELWQLATNWHTPGFRTEKAIAKDWGAVFITGDFYGIRWRRKDGTRYALVGVEIDNTWYEACTSYAVIWRNRWYAVFLHYPTCQCQTCMKAPTNGTSPAPTGSSG